MSKTLFSFKREKTFEQRLTESKHIREKYPDRIPIIVEKVVNSPINNIDKTKYLVPNDLTVGQFIHVIRKRINVPQEKGIFIFVKEKTMPPTSSLMLTIYNNYVDEDGFLYVLYSAENTFG